MESVTISIKKLIINLQTNCSNLSTMNTLLRAFGTDLIDKVCANAELDDITRGKLLNQINITLPIEP